MLAGVVEAVLSKRQNSTLTAVDVGGVIRPADDHAVADDVDLGVQVTSGAVLCPDLHEPVSLIADHFGSAASLGAPAAVDAGLKLEPAFSLELGVSFGRSLLAFGVLLGKICVYFFAGFYKVSCNAGLLLFGKTLCLNALCQWLSESRVGNAVAKSSGSRKR